ncbi:hypothetical protein K469DRAFT_695138 [Zopfia rhizophila CBS 207.26]|uniref:GDS1 winged helix domain-containing protein n=1 Tax=Zopfia rhizophila CBS 207.26 TaxID=1314779 RepID=A0A6A6DIQ0_9PEZI|nr:hypothetical protein K469DRAFT_695138 [Zopfia rhizophila CBS 207.26]
MPYNTRRKSLSLPSLGITLPNSGRNQHRASGSPPSTATGEHHQPPAKKVKRSHSTTSNVSTSTSPPRTSSLRFDDPPKSSGRVADTPPPSPGGGSGQTKVDTEGIDDTIVVGVIEQLEKTGNRPHLLKELATVLSATIPIVESSANPSAIISSRLATYLKRPWTALSKCPLDKKLVGTHPKRMYYFLTTSPHQPIPADAGNGPAAARIISPSLSSAASEEEDLEMRSRERMSPSPELDLSDFSDGSDPFSNQTHPPTSANIAHNRRAQSPPLEKDEKEFTQTASFLQQRRRSQEAERERERERERETSSSSEETQSTDVTMDDIPEVEETEESAARKNSETAAALFGQVDQVSSFHADFTPSSPILKPTLEIEMPPPISKHGDVKMTGEESEWGWSEMKSPENVELDELDDLFGGY